MLVGDFNDWDPAEHPFRVHPNGTRSVSVTVQPGQRYAFRYFCDGRFWCNDDDADGFERNQFGSENCFVRT